MEDLVFSALTPVLMIRATNGKCLASQASRVDLIAFDSPFMSDPPYTSSSDTEPDFESTWNSLQDSNARGWCEASIDVILRRLQGLQHRLTVIAADLPPFEGKSPCALRYWLH